MWVDHNYLSCDTCEIVNSSIVSLSDFTWNETSTSTYSNYSNICDTKVNDTLSCCDSDADCDGGSCWACPFGKETVEGVEYECDTCKGPFNMTNSSFDSSLPVSYPNVCQHLVNSSHVCCTSDADCGIEGGACWACGTTGETWINSNGYKCNTCT